MIIIFVFVCAASEFFTEYIFYSEATSNIEHRNAYVNEL